jgi:polyhydroxybutyrate depolymerase
MTLLLACQLSDKVSAVGAVAGAYLFPLEDCQPNRPVPAIFFHGKADKIVPYTGGPSERFDLPFPNIPEFVHAYAEKNGCDSTSTTIKNTVNVKGVRYSNCTKDAEVIFYSIADGGHNWPGGTPLPKWITGKTSQEIDATQLMWKFFQDYSLEK